MEGYIKLHRGLIDSEIFASKIGLKIWIWLLLKASYSQRYVSVNIGKGESTVKLERGELIFGRFKAEEVLNIDGSTIYKWLKKMELLDMIKLKSNNHYTIIEISNYNTYNNFESEENNIQVTAIEQPSNIQVTTKEQPRNTYKKDKKVKESKEEEIKYYFNFKKSLIDFGFKTELVDEWLNVRKVKKLINSRTAFNNFIKEVQKSNMDINEVLKTCVIKSWGGFEAKWINVDNSKNKIKVEDIKWEN